MSTLVNINLTSTVIEPKESYPWHEKMMLIPHEAIRRELLRAEKALNLMDAVNYPWHATQFNTWLSEYFFPALHEHHYVEDKILSPFYAALGEKSQFGNDYTHEELLKQMDVIVKDASDFVATVKEGAPASTVIEKHLNFKAKFADFNTYMLQHLAEEDTEWPAIFLKYGEKNSVDAENKIVDYVISLKGSDAIVSKAFFGSIVDSMGLTPKKYQTILTGTVQLSPWCGEKDSKVFWSTKPFIPRVFIFPWWVKAYATKWKPMIESIVINLEPGTAAHKQALRKAQAV